MRPRAATRATKGRASRPNVTDADCVDGADNGPHFVREKNIRVVGADLYDLDRNGNGIGCQDTDVATETQTPMTTAQTPATTRAITASGLPNTGAPVERQALAAALLLAVGIYAVRHSERFRKPGMP